MSADDFERLSGLDPGLLTAAETEALWPDVLKAAASSSDKPLFVKTHRAYTRDADGALFHPLEATHCALYLVRNPLDVCVSYSHHLVYDIERIIATLRDDAHTVTRGESNAIGPDLAMSCSSHVGSWLEAAEMKTLVVRFEDLVRPPLQSFSRLAAFAGLQRSAAQIRAAPRPSRLESLQEQEARAGFREHNPRGGPVLPPGRGGRVAQGPHVCPGTDDQTRSRRRHAAPRLSDALLIDAVIFAGAGFLAGSVGDAPLGGRGKTRIGALRNANWARPDGSAWRLLRLPPAPARSGQSAPATAPRPPRGCAPNPTQSVASREIEPHVATVWGRRRPRSEPLRTGRVETSPA